MVRLLRDDWEKNVRYYFNLSIPQWCDCCVCESDEAPEQPALSIPQWCDCCCLTEHKITLLQSAFNPTMVRLLRPFLGQN